MARLRARPFFHQLQVLTRHRLIIPLKRSRHPPEHSARGILVGLVWGLTPTVGIQIIGVSLTWLVARRVFGWNFNYLIALAWTVVTNPLTLLPLYYVFYVTGRLMLGEGSGDGVAGYQAFVGAWDRTFAPDTSWREEIATYFSVIVGDWGLRLFLGSIPYAAVAAAVGYWWGLRFVVRYRRARLSLRLKAAAQAGPVERTGQVGRPRAHVHHDEAGARGCVPSSGVGVLAVRVHACEMRATFAKTVLVVDEAPLPPPSRTAAPGSGPTWILGRRADATRRLVLARERAGRKAIGFTNDDKPFRLRPSLGKAPRAGARACLRPGCTLA